MLGGTKQFPAYLTIRQKRIIGILIQNTSCHITIVNIAQKLSVSQRTIYRELPTVQKWLENNGALLIRKKGTGLILNVKPSQRSILSELLEKENTIPAYGRDERRGLIIRELMAANAPLSTEYLKREYCISGGTLSDDVRAINEILKAKNIEMNHIKGTGIMIKK